MQTVISNLYILLHNGGGEGKWERKGFPPNSSFAETTWHFGLHKLQWRPTLKQPIQTIVPQLSKQAYINSEGVLYTENHSLNYRLEVQEWPTIHLQSGQHANFLLYYQLCTWFDEFDTINRTHDSSFIQTN